jgi:DNA-binding MarR family transcriptional regulator
MLIINAKNRDKISYSMLRVVWKLFDVDKRTRCYGTDVPLHEAEIHMIKAVKEHEGAHVTGLAETLGVTKGAVSQLIMKLQRKGMVEKSADPGNLSRLVLRLTPKGEIAYVCHEKLHQEFNALVDEALQGASRENLAFLAGFLKTMERRIDDFEKDGNQ